MDASHKVEGGGAVDEIDGVGGVGVGVGAADVLSEMTFTCRLKSLRGRMRRSSVSVETCEYIAAHRRAR